ncbi:MAG: group II intron reverse transcriptase/maturase [Acidimicrobiales bacterium]
MGELLEAIADPANLAMAWAAVRANAGAGGVDGQTVTAFGADEEHQLASLRRRLLSAERYVPPPVRRVEIPKPDGRTRPLGIPTVADRVVQQATRQVIEPFFEAKFLACSFGYRPGRNAQQAVWWVREAIRRGDRWVAEFDIVGFFDNLRHPRLLREVAKEVDDVEVIGLIRRWLSAGVLKEGTIESRTTGTPQGGVISPLLANIYLNRLDAEVRSAGLRLIRYADDFVILTPTQVEARAAAAFVRQILGDVGLEVAEAKSGVKRVTDGFEFLGFTVHGRFLRPRPRTLTSFKDRVRSRTRRTAPVSLQRMIDQLNPTLRGWGNYFAMGDVVSLFVDLDKWIRMRLRSKARKRFKSKGGVDSHRWPNHLFDELGLVRLEHLARKRRLSPATGHSLG